MTLFSDVIQDHELAIVLVVIFGALVLFAWNKWRYDIVALVALLTLALLGIVGAEEAFLGFAHPAVITVAAVLIVTKGLVQSGLVDVIIKLLSRIGDDFKVQLIALTAIVASLSAFMNNIGAMALMLPIAIRIAKKNNRSTSLYLMPLAFGSLLGGLITMIGTPPNIIIAMARSDNGMQPFSMFDFAPVGLSVAFAGLLFITLIGWRLIPQRGMTEAGQLIAHIKDYITELTVPPESELIGKRIMEIARMSDSEVIIIALVRGNQTFKAPSAYKMIQADDVLIVKGCTENIQTLIDDIGLQLREEREFDEDMVSADEVEMMEVVVSQNSLMAGRTVRGLRLHDQYGLNLLAISRQGRDLSGRLDSTRIREGDLLLVQGPRETASSSVRLLGLLPLASGELNLGRTKRILPALVLFGAGIVVAALDFVPIAIALMSVAVIMLITGLVPVKDLYTSIDWPIIILLGAMIPVGAAFDRVGGTALVASLILDAGPSMTPHLAVVIILVASMVLSDILNNAAVAVLMAPLAIEVASELSVSADPLLMAVAIGASCAFLTPIGHQSNALVMGPGGYRFTDYWPMGLPLQIVVLIVSVPAIFLMWPF